MREHTAHHTIAYRVCIYTVSLEIGVLAVYLCLLLHANLDSPVNQVETLALPCSVKEIGAVLPQ